MKPGILFAAITFAFTHPTQATLIDHGLTTLDTRTQLQWLDLTQTRGYTFAQVSSQLGTGDKFEGYRYATAAEVQGIFTQFGIPLVVPTQYLGAAAVPVARGVVAFETLFDVYPTSFFDALVADTVPGDPNSHQLFYGSGTGAGVGTDSASASIFTSFPTDPSTYEHNVYADQYTIALRATEDPPGYSNSSFLVKVQAPAVAHRVVHPVADDVARSVPGIPEPQTYALMLLGLGGVAVGVGRRRKMAKSSAAQTKPMSRGMLAGKTRATCAGVKP
jgi:PEP-CTERM motif